MVGHFGRKAGKVIRKRVKNIEQEHIVRQNKYLKSLTNEPTEINEQMIETSNEQDGANVHNRFGDHSLQYNA